MGRWSYCTCNGSAVLGPPVRRESVSLGRGRDRLALARCQHLDAVFRRLRRRALSSVSALDVTELGRRRGPGRDWVAELGEEALKAGGRDGAQQSRRRVRSVAEGVGGVGGDVR